MRKLLRMSRHLYGKIVLKAVYHIKSKVGENSSNGDLENVRNAGEKPLGLSVTCTH